MSTRVILAVTSNATRSLYPLLVGAIAFALTLSMLMPFVPVLITAVLARRERWCAIVIVSSFGSAIAGVILYLALHHLGWNQIIEAYPDLLQTKAWIDVNRWVSAYGTSALFVIAASPFAQTPALVVAAVSDLPLAEVFFALLLGKLIKYGLWAWAAAKFPGWIQHLALPSAR